MCRRLILEALKRVEEQMFNSDHSQLLTGLNKTKTPTND
jgi:hypothetical protein